MYCDHALHCNFFSLLVYNAMAERQANNPVNPAPPRPFHIGDASCCCGEPLKFIKPIRSTASTLSTSFSMANTKLLDAVGRDFGRLYVGDNFLERLLAYIDPEWRDKVPEQRPPRCCTEVVQPHKPPQQQIAAALGQLGVLESSVRAHTLNIQPLTSNESVQDVVGKQVIDLLNLIIKVSFGCSLSTSGNHLFYHQTVRRKKSTPLMGIIDPWHEMVCH